MSSTTPPLARRISDATHRVPRVLDVLDDALTERGMTLLGAQHYETTRSARTSFEQVIDGAVRGSSVTVRRDGDSVAVVDATRYRRYLARTVTADVRVRQEDGVFAMIMVDPAITVEDEDYEALVADMLLSLREYAKDWQNHLMTAPNHAENWGLVQLVELSDDTQLTAWLLGTNEHG